LISTIYIFPNFPWQIGNHDQQRVAIRFGEERVDIMNTLVTMLPGTSVTYYGEEIGMTDSCAKFETDDHNLPAISCDPETTKYEFEWSRSPMQWDATKNGGFSSAEKPWIPAAESYKTVNVKAQEGKEKSHLEIHRQLLKMRKHQAILESEHFEIKALSENSFAFKR
jgi:alpha-glucosidase